MPTLNIAAQTVQPGAHVGAWHNVPAGVSSLVCAVDLSTFTDAATVFGLRIEWSGDGGATAHTLVEGWVAGGSPTPGQWGLGYSQSTPTAVNVQARYIAAVGSLDANGNPQLSGGNPVAIGASSVVVS